MKNIHCPFIKSLAMLLVLTGLSVACAARLRPAYITGLSFAEQPPAPRIVAVPLLQNMTTLGTPIERGLQFLLDSVIFETNKASLRPQGKREIEEFAKHIQQYSSRTVLIEGHTDNRGGKAHNQRLSQRRANTVREALIANGIEPERVIAKGFGEDKPVATNATSEGRQQNRRVEITILNEGVTP
ncbi:MAG TPA: OmpA family protein [Thioploca sp.]|nr:MAG: hypothetical protein DRR08_18310 [Gammaproteobacteria bacterium]HDN25987.1 OmpA family protein [Thioploca sp.]